MTRGILRGRDERHDPTHLDGARRGPLAVDQQHVVWRELELAVGVGDLDDTRTLLHGCKSAVWSTDPVYCTRELCGGWEGTLAGMLVLRRASLCLCWLTMTRVNSYASSLPALRT